MFVLFPFNDVRFLLNFLLDVWDLLIIFHKYKKKCAFSRFNLIINLWNDQCWLFTMNVYHNWKRKSFNLSYMLTFGFFIFFSALNASNPLNLGLNFNINVKFVCHRLQNGMLLLNSGCMEVIKMGPYNYQLTDYLIRGLT